MKTRVFPSLCCAVAAALLVGCVTASAPLPGPVPAPPPGQPIPVPPPGSAEVPPVPSEPPPRPAIRTLQFGAATSSLVNQARAQSARGEHAAAIATVERALRIEPENALVWIELGKMRLASGDAAQAENMARKALALASNAPAAQSSAWRLIADSYRARDRNVEARDADQQAAQLSPR